MVSRIQANRRILFSAIACLFTARDRSLVVSSFQHSHSHNQNGRTSAALLRRLSGMTQKTTHTHTQTRLRQAYSEEEASYIMSKAQECAFSDTCSMEDAEMYLREVVHVQGDCAAGVISGHDLCEDVTLTVEIVAGLRDKIAGVGASRKLRMAFQSASVEASRANERVRQAVVPMFVVLLGIYAANVAIQASHNDGVVPFTAQEWYWSLRDGYFDTMVFTFLSKGGLTAVEHGIGAGDDYLPFTAEEWTWALRDGYLGDMISSSFRHGGL